MFVVKEKRLNKFKHVNIPNRREMFNRYAGRPVSDFNRVPDVSDLPDNLGGNTMDDYRAGMQILQYEEYKKRMNDEMQRLSEFEQSKKTSDDEKNE